MEEVSDNNPQMSVVTPVYGCADCLQKLYERLAKTLSSIDDLADFEILMVNDASPDGAWEKIKELAAHDYRVKGLNLSRNFGQHHAITAGLDCALGTWIVVMDCDLQDQPEEIKKLYNKAKEGYEVVFGRRAYRKDTLLKRLGSNVFYRLLTYFTDKEFDPAIANFCVISKKVVNSLKSMREQNRNFPLAVGWLGFKSCSVDIEHAARVSGKSAYSLRKLVYFAYDIIVSHSNKPLRISVGAGFIMALGSLAFAIYLVLKYLLFGVPVAGWTSTMVSIYFVGGILMANMGIIGIYLGKAFNEAKNRPLYVVAESENLSPGQQAGISTGHGHERIL